MVSRILSIAGTDPSGGAGIQADIKTITAFKSYALSVVTALVAQNTTGVKAILDIPIDFISEQVDCILEDIDIDAIKIGMLNKPGVVNLISKKIQDYSITCPIVIDPVMVAKSGDILLTKEARSALIKNLLPHAFIITPNIPEAEIISEMHVESEDDMISAGKVILSMGPSAVLMKGGHSKGRLVKDFLIQKNSIDVFEENRIDTKNTHGTGCTLSAAIASGLANKINVKESISIAHKYVYEAIRTAPNIGKGHGPLNHMHSIKPMII
tara:strand:- start:88 stop:891 length:804 start_codon:yes stop_codon:yes gene_type:complete